MNNKTNPSILCSHAMQQGITERGKYLQQERCMPVTKRGVGGGTAFALFYYRKHAANREGVAGTMGQQCGEWVARGELCA